METDPAPYCYAGMSFIFAGTGAGKSREEETGEPGVLSEEGGGEIKRGKAGNKNITGCNKSKGLHLLIKGNIMPGF